MSGELMVSVIFISIDQWEGLISAAARLAAVIGLRERSWCTQVSRHDAQQQNDEYIDRCI